MASLKLIKFHGAKVTDVALASLRQSLPECHIDE
jgi:hypothetical protein